MKVRVVDAVTEVGSKFAAGNCGKVAKMLAAIEDEWDPFVFVRQVRKWFEIL